MTGAGEEPAPVVSLEALADVLVPLGVPREVVEAMDARVLTQALGPFLAGYRERAEQVLDGAPESAGGEPCEAPIVVRDVPFTSICRHHLMPFRGTATVAVLPDGRETEPAALARLVHLHAHRLQTNRGLTDAVAADLERVLEPRGVFVAVEGRATCPGEGGTVVTRARRGDFRLPLWHRRLDAML